MTSLAANFNRKWYGEGPRNFVEHGVDAGDNLLQGALVEYDSDGYLIEATGAFGNVFAGVKVPERDGTLNADNSGGADGAINARLATEGVALWDKTGSFTQADIGIKLKAADDNTVEKNLATVDTNLSNATQNDLTFTASKLFSGEIGNQISVKYVDPGGTSATEGVVVEGFTIIVNLGRAASAVNSTGTSVKAAIEAHALASKMVSVALKTGNDGSGLVAAMAAINLSGAGPTCGVLEEIVGTKLKVNHTGFAGRRAA
ncbi:hypothetical protein IT575_12155 [bacterium]|nr:hypothetical protein [bacterium]